jgi:hypothetical protein
VSARLLYIVGCGASKLDREAPARELYTGSLFVAARRHVEALGAPWLVLSAKYGVVDPDHVLRPYEQKLAKRGEDLGCWARASASGAVYLTARWIDRERGIPDPAPNPRRFVFLCGVEYAVPVARVLESQGYRTEQPLTGLQLGERLRWFRQQREAA